MIETAVSAAAMRIVRLLVGNPPETIDVLAKKLDVTRTAITDKLDELVAAGFVERIKPHNSPSGRGRPRHLFRTTDAALCLLFAGNQHQVVPAIWQALDQVGGPALTQKVLRQLSINLAEHYRAQFTSHVPEERLKQLAAILRQEGGIVEVKGTNGHVVLRKRSCAFVSMFEPTGKVCQIDESFISQVVGAPVRKVTCRHQGDPCCSFEVASSAVR